MKIRADSAGTLVLEEVWDGVVFKTDEGHKLYVCMSDGDFELNFVPAGSEGIPLGSWYRSDLETNSILPVEILNKRHMERCCGTTE